MSWPWEVCACGHIRDDHLAIPEYVYGSSCQAVRPVSGLPGSHMTCSCQDFEPMQAVLV